MSTLHKQYEKLDNGQEIKMTIGYRKGGISWATSERVESGYYVSVVPVQRSTDGMWEQSGAFSGFNDTLCKYDRQSSKRLQEAIKTLQDRKEMYLEQFKEGGRYAVK